MMNFAIVLVASVVLQVSALPTVINEKLAPKCSQNEIELAVGEQAAVRSYLDDILNRQYSEQCYEATEADWKYTTNITNENEKIKLAASLTYSSFHKETVQKLVTQFPLWRCIQDRELLRKFKKMALLGTASLPEDRLTEYNKIVNDMETIYSTAKVCSYQDSSSCNLSLEPDASKIMKTSRDYEELQHIWTAWHNNGSKGMRPMYQRFVELSNEAADLNGFSDTGAYWLHEYETDSFKDDIEELWQTMKPFYQQVHAYVRGKLRKFYGADKFGSDGLIPAHLLGNMWSQTWDNIMEIVVPFPDQPSIDVTDEMKRQGYTPLKMFEKSEEFFTSIGLIPMPDEFWKKSIIEKPSDREIVCHASAWDFCNGKDFRIKQCTEVTMEDLIVVHHEMGHIQYDLQYKNQPYVYRTGANPGFHEAVGDTLALSVKTPRHLKEIGLLDNSTAVDDYETSINFLFSMALSKIVFLPFGYIMDKWRWDVFDSTVSPDNFNCHWWKLREQYQGIKSPVTRSENDFDPGAKYHIPANVEYIRYFVSTVVQFQFHRALCLEAGQYDPADSSKPLHNCDIYQSKRAGAKLADMLSLGASKPWPEAMRAITGQSRMDASAIREFFKPLEDWLMEENEKAGEIVGWTPEYKSCQASDHVPETPNGI